VGPLIFISLVLLAGSYGVRWWARWQQARGQAISLAAQVPLAQLASDAASVAQELGAGSFRQEVKIRGKVVCDAPLTAELSRISCVSYRFSVTREYEEVLWEKDSMGNTVQKTQRKSEVVASQEASVPFWLDDGTARILVHPDHAKIDRIPSHSSFQPTPLQKGVGVGSFVLNLGAHPGGTLGYRYEEHCLPLDQEVTVVAEAGDEGGQLALRKPEAEGAPFLVTPKTFSELAQGNKTLVAVLKGTSIGLAAVAVLIFLLGVIR
jgi:hypothetical protein